MKSKTLHIIGRLKKDESGNMSIMAAAFMLLSVMLIGYTIDMTRMTQSSAKLKSLNDNAALAATLDFNKTLAERKEIFETVMNQGMLNSKEVSEYEYDLSFVETDYTITLEATSTAKTDLFFPLSEGETKSVTAFSEVIAGKETIEVALVLDISSSMNGTRIAELKKASENFITILLENVEIRDRVFISIVPYGGTVRLSDAYKNMLIQPDEIIHWENETWNGCFDMLPDDYDGGILPTDNFEYLPHFYVWNKNNPWCPNPGNEMVELTNDKDTLLDTLNNFTLSDGTGTDIGVAWGFASLDPRWRGKVSGADDSMPKDFNDKTKKIMIVMTDGGITAQYYPKDSQMTGSLPYFTKSRISKGGEATGGFLDTCDLAKDENIEVYTVGFLMRNASQINTLKACSSGETYHHEADLGELEGVFEKLANSVTSLRLTQ